MVRWDTGSADCALTGGVDLVSNIMDTRGVGRAPLSNAVNVAAAVDVGVSLVP